MLARRAFLHSQNPVEIPTERLYDVSMLLVERYGANYIEHPRLRNLVKLNGFTDLNFLTGPEEAAAFADRNYSVVHQSTVRKVDCIGSILDRAVADRLKTRASWWERKGLSLRAVPCFLKDHWLWTVIGILASVSGIFGISMRDCGAGTENADPARSIESR